MGNTLKTYRRVLTVLGGVALVAGLAACTAAGPEAGGSGAASPRSTPSPTGTATVPPPAVDPAVTAAWAAGAVPSSGSDGFIMAQNGAFPDGAAGSFSLTASTLPPGTYSIHLACRGDAQTTVTLTVDNEEELALAGRCSDVSQGMTFSTTADGVTIALLGDSEEPVEWALAITDLLAGANG